MKWPLFYERLHVNSIILEAWLETCVLYDEPKDWDSTMITKATRSVRPNRALRNCTPTSSLAQTTWILAGIRVRSRNYLTWLGHSHQPLVSSFVVWIFGRSIVCSTQFLPRLSLVLNFIDFSHFPFLFVSFFFFFCGHLCVFLIFTFGRTPFRLLYLRSRQRQPFRLQIDFEFRVSPFFEDRPDPYRDFS